MAASGRCTASAAPPAPSFTPTSKWNGTGGFCAYNGSRFAEGWSLEAVRRVLTESAPEADPDRAEVMALVLSAQTLKAGLAVR